MIPKHKSAEFFGFWGVFEKFAGLLGPLLFSVAVETTGSSRKAILSIIAFFVLGALVLMRVDVGEGQRAVREENEGLREA
jgi:UMF1 family MFS transporter